MIVRALFLYERNEAISAAFCFPLQVVEVALRNACHRELVKIFGPAWCDEPRKRLRRMKLALPYYPLPSVNEQPKEVDHAESESPR